MLYHCDAVQAAGKVDLSPENGMQADSLSLTGHKFHAPKGVGALYVRRNAPFSPMIHGGHQELNLRGGTECLPLFFGMGKAAEPESAASRQIIRFSLDTASTAAETKNVLSGVKARRHVLSAARVSHGRAGSN